MKTQRVKLLEVPLPTFDGKVENWLSFKNAFRNMIGSRTDLSDIDKLHSKITSNGRSSQQNEDIRDRWNQLFEGMGIVSTLPCLRSKNYSYKIFLNFTAFLFNFEYSRVRENLKRSL